MLRKRFSVRQNNYVLTKIKSVDCKAYKLTLDVPIHTSCMGAYREVGLPPFMKCAQLASAKYIHAMHCHKLF